MWSSLPSSFTMRPNNLEQESGNVSVLCQTLPEETSGEVCVSVNPNENTVSGICLWAVRGM